MQVDVSVSVFVDVRMAAGRHQRGPATRRQQQRVVVLVFVVGDMGHRT